MNALPESAGHLPAGVTPEVSAAEARRTALEIAPGVLLAGVGSGMAFPILPIVGLHAGLSLPFIGTILAANRIGRILVNPAVGRLADRYGPKRMLVAGLALQVAVLGLYCAGVLTGHPGIFFLLGRLLHGPASSGVFVGGQTLAIHAGGERHRGMSAGIVRSAQSAGMPLGLAAGGVLAGALGPAAAFGVAMIAPALAAAAAQRVIPDLRPPGRELPSFRQLLATLLDRRVGAIAAMNLVGVFAAQGVILTTLVLVLEQRGLRLLGLSVLTSSGLFMSCFILCLIATAPAAGWLSDRPGWRARLATGGLVALAPGMVAIGLAHSLPVIAAGLALAGVAMGALTTPLVALLGDLTPPRERGSAIGCLQLAGDAGGALGPIVGASLLARSALLTYGGTAVLVVLAVPIGLWLMRAERAGVV